MGEIEEIDVRQDKMPEVWLCPDCDAEICPCVLERIRGQEDAMIVARDTIKSLDLLNNKLTKEKELLAKRNKELESKARQTENLKLKTKMDAIDHQAEKMANRGKLIG